MWHGCLWKPHQNSWRLNRQHNREGGYQWRRCRFCCCCRCHRWSHEGASEMVTTPTTTMPFFEWRRAGDREPDWEAAADETCWKGRFCFYALCSRPVVVVELNNVACVCVCVPCSEEWSFDWKKRRPQIQSLAGHDVCLTRVISAIVPTILCYNLLYRVCVS